MKIWLSGVNSDSAVTMTLLSPGSRLFTKFSFHWLGGVSNTIELWLSSVDNTVNHDSAVSMAPLSHDWVLFSAHWTSKFSVICSHFQKYFKMWTSGVGLMNQSSEILRYYPLKFIEYKVLITTGCWWWHLTTSLQKMMSQSRVVSIFCPAHEIKSGCCSIVQYDTYSNYAHRQHVK
jgi:hypothetical protein